MCSKAAATKNRAPAITISAPWRVKSVTLVEEYTLEVVFMDGVFGKVDCKKLIFSPDAGVFSMLADLDTFNDVHLQYGVVTWTCGLDLAPDAMYNEILKNGVWIPE